MEQAEVDAVLAGIAALVADHYVFPDVASHVQGALRDARAAGRYPAGTDPAVLAELVTEDLQSVNGDGHLRLIFSAGELPVDSGDADTNAAIEHSEYERLAARSGAGISKVEILSHNLGYLRIDRLFAPSISGQAVGAAFTLVAGTDGLILDLRRRAGGSPWAVAFVCSYFLPVEPRYLYGIFLRETDAVEQFWSQSSLPGPRYGTDRPLVVLTSRATFSAGESLASCLREQGRATLVGETTGGGANPCQFYRVHPHLRATIPVGRSVSIVTGKNWEGVGLRPDIEVPADLALGLAESLIQKTLRAGVRPRQERDQSIEVGAVQGANGEKSAGCVGEPEGTRPAQRTHHFAIGPRPAQGPGDCQRSVTRCGNPGDEFADQSFARRN